MTRLLLVEDHTLVRQSMRAFLENAALDVVGEATTGNEAVEMAIALQPDIVIMDIHLPQISGIEATRRIRKSCRGTHVIALTAYNEQAYIRALKDAGADGFVLKTAEFSELLDVIRTVMLGHSHLGDDMQDMPIVLESADMRLTNRELEVLICTARGWTNKQIGTHLNISDRTVQVHLQTVYQKLNAASRTEAVARAISLGLISPPDGAAE